MLLLKISLLLLLTCLSNAQDQAFSTLLNSSITTASQCEPDQSYLIEEMNELRGFNNLSSSLLKTQPFPELLVKRSCVLSALNQVTAGRPLSDNEKKHGRKKYAANNFVRCDENNSYETYQETPCQSQESIKLIHNSFETVTQCLKDFVSGSSQISAQNEWVKLYFKMLTKESGLQNYVQSKRGAIGAGQLTPQYIRDFVEFSMEDVRNHLEKSTHQVCRRLGHEILSDEAFSYMAKKKSSNAYTFNRCALVGTNHNQILRNLLIGFSNLKTERMRARKYAFQNQFVKIPQSEQLKVELALIPLAYNMGSGNLEYTIEKALNEDRTFADSTSFIQAVYKSIPSKFKETKNYQSNIDNRYADVLKGSGQKSCFN